jgi:MoaA/NifB/PqqE/SkfB family radical SAM enzyme
MLHVLVGAQCNNNCLFCMEADRGRRAERIASQSTDDIRRMIDQYPHPDEVLFTSGEPTLDPGLPTYIGWAKQRGFRAIGLVTNGRRLAYRGYAQELVDAGLNRVTVSIHGHTAALHDGQTRSPGSFEQSLAGLDEVVRLARTRHLRVHTSTVLNRRTLPHLEEIRHLLSSRGADVTVFNAMMGRGRGAEHASRLLAPYPDVVQEVARLCRELPQSRHRTIRVEDIPACFSAQLPRAVRGELEEYQQFEESGSSGMSEHGLTDGQVATEDPALAHDFRDASGRVDLQGDGTYYLTCRSLKDRVLREKGEVCQKCSLEPACAGVWEPYVRCHGWVGFIPVEERSGPRPAV